MFDDLPDILRDASREGATGARNPGLVDAMKQFQLGIQGLDDLQDLVQGRLCDTARRGHCEHDFTAAHALLRIQSYER